MCIWFIHILLCVDDVWYPYPPGFLHWHWGNHMIAPVPVKEPWRLWVIHHVNLLRELNMTTVEQSTTKLGAYSMGCIAVQWMPRSWLLKVAVCKYCSHSEQIANFQYNTIYASWHSTHCGWKIGTKLFWSISHTHTVPPKNICTCFVVPYFVVVVFL